MPPVFSPVFDWPELGDLYRHGHFDKLIIECRKRLDASLARMPVEEAEILQRLEDLGRAYLENGEYVAAADTFEELARMRRSRGGKSAAALATDLNNLGRIYIEIGRFPDAERILRQALNIAGALPLAEGSAYAPALMNMAILARRRGKWKVAQELLTLATKRRLKEYGGFHPKFGIVFHHLARLYRDSRCHAAAESAIRKAIRIYRNAEWTENVDYATMLQFLAQLRVNAGDLGEGKERYQAAVAILREIRRPGDALFMQVEGELAELESRVGHSDNDV